MKVNSSLGASCIDFENLGRFADAQVQSHAPNSQKTPQSPPQNTRIVDSRFESSLRGSGKATTKQSKHNNLHEVQTESCPIRGAKNRIQTSSSASADFLLEKDLRGSPPKSEKRQLLARRGSGAGGAALLRKEKGDKDSTDSKADLTAESHKKIDSNLPLDSRDLDSSLTAFAQNDNIVDLSQKNNALFKNAIALTGGIATGKSTTCNILKLHGYSIIDTDSIAHNMLEQSKDEVVGAFGDEILERDSSDSCESNKSNLRINRKKLGAIVFNDKTKLATLESILHPKIRAEVSRQAQNLDAQGILYFIDIPLFFELQTKGNGYEIPRVLLIYAPKELQLSRMQKRDNLSANEAQNRLANQMDIEAKRQMADFVIENVGNIRDLQSKIEAFLKRVN